MLATLFRPAPPEGPRRPFARLRAWTAGLLVALAATLLAAAPPAPLKVATFDSGFGGFLTAKSIEGAAAGLLRDYDATLTIRHYGDTQNLPYGEKSPDQIAHLGSAGVLKAFQQGADMVFIACNTASTQYQRIRQAVDQAYPGQDRPVVSIIDASSREAKRLLDQTLARRPSAVFTILATPATVRSMVYPRGLAALYGAPLVEEPPRIHTQPRWNTARGASIDSLTQRNRLDLPGGRRIEVLQMAPANWVELIELGADAATKEAAIRRDLGLLQPLFAQAGSPDVVGYFCTHYPIFDPAIRAEVGARNPGAPAAAYISQGQLMADLFVKLAEGRLGDRRRARPLGPDQLRPLVEGARATITISGKNGAVTRDLARTLFPADPVPQVTEEDLGLLGARPEASGGLKTGGTQ